MQPKRRGKHLVILFLIILILILIGTNVPDIFIHRQFAGTQKGSLAPDFTLETPAGEKFTLSTLKGHPVVINFWATWCPPCRSEMPVIEEYYNEYKSRGLIVLGVNLTSQDNPLDIVPFIEEYNLTFPILLDETGELGPKYDLRSLPSTYFIDRFGMITEIVIGGPISEVLLQNNIEKILNNE